jgi:DNA replication protein DnaC
VKRDNGRWTCWPYGVGWLAGVRHAGTLQAELIRLTRYPLLVVDEVCCIHFEPEAASLFFQLVSSRCATPATSHSVAGATWTMFNFQLPTADEFSAAVDTSRVLLLPAAHMQAPRGNR